MIILSFFLGHWYLSLFTQTFFLHRYVSHGMFKMNAFWEKFFFLLTLISQGSSFLNPAAYGVMHRAHHAHTDTEKDPHSPLPFTNPIHYMMETYRFYRKTYHYAKEIKTKIDRIPRWRLMEDIGESIYTQTGFAVFYLVFYINYASSIWQFILVPVHIFMGPVHGFIVNWFGHKFGYRNHDELRDQSRNILPIDVLMFGESYHNNHHKNPNSPNFGKRWFEIDPCYLICLLFKKIKIIS